VASQISSYKAPLTARQLNIVKNSKTIKAIFGLLALGYGIIAAAETAPALADNTLTLTTCELSVPGTPLTEMAECGWYEMPENPDEPDGRTIRLRVARVPATGRSPEPDPLIFFAGGPGQAATESWPIISGAIRKVRENRDILLVDQRGTGQSNPLKCPQVELEEALGLDWDDLGKATKECLDSLDADPRFYTTTIAMHDVHAVSQALGYEQVNLFGGSYGTRAAQVYLRLFPEQVRSVVLDGVVPQTLALGSEHALKLDQAIYRVLANCDLDPQCGELFPDSAGKLRELIQVLDEAPVELEVIHPSTGKPINLTFNRDVLGSSLRFLTYSPESQAMLPLLIHEAASTGNLERLASQMLIAAGGLQESIAQGMEMSVVCAEDVPFFDPQDENSDLLLGNAMTRASRIQCEIWPRGPMPENFHDPVSSDVPVLLLSGELDPVTPPEYAESVAQHFPNSRHLVAPGQAHIVTTRGCMGKLVTEFIINAGFEILETDCIAQMQPSPFFISLTGPTP
jgi:pimeloyl-ACP methyl ester carboxylesterase